MPELLLVLACLGVGAVLAVVGLLLIVAREEARRRARVIAYVLAVRRLDSTNYARMTPDAARLDVCRVPGESDAEIIEGLLSEGHSHRRSEA